MDKLGDLLTDWLYGLQTDFKRLMVWLDRLGTGQRALLLIVLGLVPPLLYWMFLGRSYNGQQLLALVLILLLLYSIGIALVIAWYRAKAREKVELKGFVFKKYFPQKLDSAYFGFDNGDRDNLELLMGSLAPGDRINIRALGRNRAGNLRFLLTFLDMTLEGGIQNLDRDARLSLSQLILDNFSFNGNQINPNTIPSSYSKWNDLTQNGGYDSLRDSMAIALGQG